MRKKSFNAKNNTAQFIKPLGGMCNTLSGEYLKDNQASNISGVIYNEDNNSFQGAYLFDKYSIYDNIKFQRLFTVSFHKRQCLFASYKGGVYNITNKKQYAVEKDIIPSDIIYNQDGLFIASSYNIYHLKNDESIVKVTFSLSPFAWQRLSPRQSNTAPANSLFYHNSRLYFSDSRGIGYLIESSNEVTILHKEPLNIDFCLCGSQLYAVTFTHIYLVNHNDFIEYADLTQYNFKTRFTAAYGNELLAVSKVSKGYEVTAFNTVSKKIKKYKVSFTKGYNTPGFKYIRVCDNNIYFLINETDKTLSSIKSTLYEASFNGNTFSIKNTLFTDFKSTLSIQHIMFINDSLFCYFSAVERNPNAVSTIQLYEYTNKSLILLDYLNAPDNAASSTTIALNNNRLYAANMTGIYYVDIVHEKEYIPCLLTQNGRLCVPQGSNLYFSGAGDFYNWSWGSHIDALFVEIGYKDGGSINYAVLVLDSIIIFKDNGSIYRLAGNYPEWNVTKLGEVDNITSRALNWGSKIIFGSTEGIKQISATEYYGDFMLSDYQNIMQDKNIIDISLCSSRNNIIFISNNYIFEYSIVLGSYYIYDDNKNRDFIQIMEIYNPDKSYSTYALDKAGNLYIQNKNKISNIYVRYREIKSSINMVVKSITVYTPTLNTDKTFHIIISGSKYILTLKAEKNRHKFFITKKVSKLQIEITHEGDFFIDNIFIEYSHIGE